MATIKFSQFADKTSPADSDRVVGYSGTSNIRIAFSNLWSYISGKADTRYLPIQTSSQTIPANTGSGAWYRIATSPVNVGRCDGIIELEFIGSGYHSRIALRAGVIYNRTEAVYITRLGGSDYLNGGLFTIEQARVVYKANTYSEEYAYVEVYVKNYHTSLSGTLYTRLYNATGWTPTTGSGSIPTGYTSNVLYINNANPYYATNDLRSVITVSSGAATIDMRNPSRNTVAMNISGNTTINLSYLYEGCVGNILLNVTTTSTITIGTVTDSTGSAVSKKYNGNLTNLEAGYYIISYKVIPDPAGTMIAFFNISPKYS